MRKISLTKAVLGTHFLEAGVISHPDGSLSKAYELEPLSSGLLEESFEGQTSDAFFAKLSDLLTKLPNLIEGQLIVSRRRVAEGLTGFVTKIYAFEKVQKAESYSHLQALLSELKLSPSPLEKPAWLELLSGYFGEGVLESKIPDITWDKECVTVSGRGGNAGGRVVRALSITELPQITWKGCLQPVFENPNEFILSVRFNIPDRVNNLSFAATGDVKQSKKVCPPKTRTKGTNMEAEAVLNLAKALAIAVGGIAPAFAIGKIAAKAMESIGRNPESSDRIFVPMLLGMAFAEAIAIYALVVTFTLK